MRNQSHSTPGNSRCDRHGCRSPRRGGRSTCHAERDAVLAFADELNSCVAAVTDHLDLTHVRRVPHTVVEEKRTGIEYALDVETSEFVGDAERRYSACCATKGEGTPRKFRIDQRVD